jgi:hypothetical protein
MVGKSATSEIETFPNALRVFARGMPIAPAAACHDAARQIRLTLNRDDAGKLPLNPAEHRQIHLKGNPMLPVLLAALNGVQRDGFVQQDH